MINHNLNNPFLQEDDFFKSSQLSNNGLLLKAKVKEDLESIKKQLIVLLTKQLQKSFEIDFNDELLIKDKSYPVGTTREWQGKKYKKIRQGKWMRVYSGDESRGEKLAIAATIKKIQNAKSIEELAEIVRDNRKRFLNIEGKVAPVVEKLLGMAKEKRGEKPDQKESNEKEAVENTLNNLKKKGYIKATINDKNEIFLAKKDGKDSMVMPNVYETKHKDLVEKIFGKISKSNQKESEIKNPAMVDRLKEKGFDKIRQDENGKIKIINTKTNESFPVIKKDYNKYKDILHKEFGDFDKPKKKEDNQKLLTLNRFKEINSLIYSSDNIEGSRGPSTKNFESFHIHNKKTGIGLNFHFNKIKNEMDITRVNSNLPERESHKIILSTKEFNKNQIQKIIEENIQFQPSSDLQYVIMPKTL